MTGPDASKGNHCKHILSDFLRLLTSELAEIFRDAPPAPGSVATARIREAYAKATGKAPATSSQEDASAGGKKRRIPVEGDDCPVCYEGMHGSPQSKLAFCEECRNALHKECFQQWARSKPNPTCVFCRAKWVAPGASGASGSANTSEGYVNLGGVAGVSPVRDTSTCKRRTFLCFIISNPNGRRRRLPGPAKRSEVLWVPGLRR
ncbi:hypothetical protein BD410DRAFT_872596 [Rickenella mellea]|uniref:RING-type domain-containing protein n=1 Tax=Rickenella mellea TaxID=50990 RepID=A0A4Y7PFQ3_9AGAM|nr:hypothetical protein BD410DRAFT_872596 [Rickenella mellea]